MKTFLAIVFVLLAIAIPQRTCAEQKVALLIGVEDYDKAGFSRLSYAEDDVDEVARQLISCGFRVRKMKGSSLNDASATKTNIESYLNDQFYPGIGKLNKDDIVLVFFAGHGLQKTVSTGEDMFFCPRDAHPSREQTWISISQFIDRLATESGSRNNLVLIDSCRDTPLISRGIDGKGIELRKDNLSVLFACSYGQTAKESREMKQGVFSYCLIQALAGIEKDRLGNVHWAHLTSFIGREVPKITGGLQEPHLVTSMRGAPPVFRILAGPHIAARPTLDQKQAPILDVLPKPERHNLGSYLVQPVAGLEWKVFDLKQSALDNLTQVNAPNAGFIQKRSEWQQFWRLMNADSPVPDIDFSRQLVVVDAVNSPRWITSRALSDGHGHLSVQRDFATHLVDEKAGLFNAHVYVINTKYVHERMPIRLGVTVHEAVDGSGMEVTHVVDGTAATSHRILGDLKNYYTLEKGDIILSFNGTNTTTFDAFGKAIQAASGNVRSRVKNIRTGEVNDSIFTLDE